MAVKASGANVNLRLRGTAGDSETDINEEINGESTDANANVSLATLSTGVGFDTADGGHKMSEFFGYSASQTSTTKWLTGDNAGNLFYTQADNGLTGWTAGPQLGSSRGWFRGAVYNGSGWVAGFDNEIYATTDATATSGWTLTKSGTNSISSLMWTGSGWLAMGRYDAFYCTDTVPNGSTSWTTFDLGNINVSGVVSNDGTNSFMASRAFPEFTIRWHLFNDLTEPTSQTTRDIGSHTGSGAYFVPDGNGAGNDVYLATSSHPNSFYYTVNTSNWSGATLSTKNIGATGRKFDYNDSYYAFVDTTLCKVTSTSGNLVSGSYSTSTLTSLGIDRMSALFWNGTSWMAGVRSTSGNSYFAVVKNASNPQGTWTAISTPSGFNGTRCLAIAPSKRPYYNTMTNLGG